jgi:hypothetical protein
LGNAQCSILVVASATRADFVGPTHAVLELGPTNLRTSIFDRDPACLRRGVGRCLRDDLLDTPASLPQTHLGVAELLVAGNRQRPRRPTWRIAERVRWTDPHVSFFHLKEAEFRFNHRRQNPYHSLVEIYRNSLLTWSRPSIVPNRL